MRFTNWLQQLYFQTYSSLIRGSRRASRRQANRLLLSSDIGMRKIEKLEDRLVLTPLLSVFVTEPGPDPAIIAAPLIEGPPQFRFEDGNGWTSTVTNGSGLVQGDPITLKWGIVPDGSTINPGVSGESSDPSDLISVFDGIFGAGPGGSDLTLRPWFSIFSNSLNRLSELNSVTYVYQAITSNKTIPTTGGNATTPDILIGGHSIDGQSGSNTLAYNYFPNTGDMVIDTDNLVFYGDTSNSSRSTRNVLMHEFGHGLGIDHLESSDGLFLMEPFINTTFDGPQLDDILALQRGYGDFLERSGGNNTSATATNFGTISVGSSASRGALGDSTAVASNQTDFISIDDESDVDFFRFALASAARVSVTLTPRGTTYQEGPEDGTQASFNARAQSDLTLQLISSNGTTVLQTANVNGLGGIETIANFDLSAAGTYFAKVTGATIDKTQLYGISVSVTNSFDYGDAPDSYGTLSGSNGARHTVAGPFLGATVDSEANGQPGVGASGDGTDEDGITVLDPLVAGSTVQIKVTTGGTGAKKLDYFFDFDRNGTFGNNPNEIFSVTLSGGSEMIPVTIPAGVSGTTYARFRLSTSGGLGATGAATDGEVEDYQFTIFSTAPTFDFGDAPDPNYATTLSNNGARHIATGPQLGGTRDGETNGQPNSTATGDGIDDDGVTFRDIFRPGATVPVRLVSSVGGGVLNAFFDWNSNGVWGDNSNEIVNVTLSGGMETINIAVPAGAVVGVTYARFRISTAGLLSATGFADDGEVEDYQLLVVDPSGTVAFQGFDTVTAPALPSGWGNTSSGTTAQNWTTVSGGNSDSPLNHAFVSDPVNTTDSRLTSPIVVPTLPRLKFRNSFDVEDTYDGGVLEISTSSINGGAFTDILAAGGAFVSGGYTDTISSNFGSAIGGRQAWSGSSGGYIDTIVTLPALALNQNVQFRWRFVSDTSQSGIGWRIDSIQFTGDGTFNFDYGDAPDPQYPTLIASSGASHAQGFSGVFLGSSVDVESNGQPSAAATGDDTNGDDENGVTLPTSVIQGESIDITVNSASGGLLSAWVDFNDDGDWVDVGEQISRDRVLTAGDNIVSVVIPATATVTSQTFARFRVSTNSGQGPDGRAPDGEVEDYTLAIIADTAPSVTSIVRQTPSGSPTNADTLVFRVTFSEDVTGVAAVDFAASGTTAALSVTTVSASVYDVTLTGGDLAGLNAIVGLNLSSPMIHDLNGNALPNVEPLTDETYLVDNTAPATMSFVRLTPSATPTNADLLTFRVTFSEAVTGVAAADFSVSGTSAILSVQSVSPTVYDVTLTGGNLALLNGNVGLNLASPTINDLAGNALPNVEPLTDQNYDVDNAAPSTTSFVRLTPSVSPSNLDTLVFRVTFSEDVTGVAPADFAASGTTATLSVAVVSAAVYDVTLTGGDLSGLSGPVGLNFSSPTINDLAGNVLPGIEPGTDQIFLVDNTAPFATSFRRHVPVSLSTNNDTLAFRVTFSEDVTGVTAADFVVSGTTASLNVVALSGAVYDVELTGGDLAVLNGSVGLNFASPTVFDMVGNALSNTEPAINETYLVDNTAPSTISFVRQVPSTSQTTSNTLIFRATFNEAVSAVSAADFAVTGTSATVTEVNPVSGTNGTQYDITVSGGDLAGLNGTVGLNFVVEQDIVDDAGNALPTIEPSIDQTYIIVGELQVTSLTPTSNGFVVEFNSPISSSGLNLYDQGGLQGAADVVVEGEVVGIIHGTLIIDPGLSYMTFVNTTGMLAPDTYTVTVKTGENAFRSSLGQLLDGNGDGTAGDDYVQTFVVAAPPSDAVIVSLPNFVRGFSQVVNIPANAETAGIPLTISSGLGLAAMELELQYDPSLLELTAFTLNVDVAAGGGEAQLTFPSAGRAILTVDSTTQFANSAGELVLGSFSGRVPNDARIGAKHILDITDLHLFTDSPGLNEVNSIGVDAVHLAAFFGDANGNGTYNSPDTTLVRRIVGQINTGLSAYPLVDPVLLVDITSNGAIQSSDSTSIRRAVGQIPVANIPLLPTGIAFPVTSGLDPRIFIPQTLTVAPGGSVTVPVKVEVTEVAGITISGFDVAIEFDASKFTVASSQLGALFVGSDLSGTLTQPAPGRLIFTADSSVGSSHFNFGTIGDLFTVTFNVAAGAPSGTSVINLLASSGPTLTAMFDNNLNDLILIPAPTNGAGDAIDGLITVDATAPTATSFVRLTPGSNPTNADELVFRVTFSEGVTAVAAADFAASGTTAALSVAAVSASVYDVTLSGGNLAGLNGTVGLDFATSPTIQDLVGNAFSNAEPATDETYLVDNTAPSVTSFVRQNPATSPTNSDTLVFRVTFSEGVTGVAAADFAASGTTAALSVTVVSASVYDVTLSGGNLAGLNGTVGLDFASPTIQDLAGNTLPNVEPATDETYLVDNAAPTAISFVRLTPGSNPTNADELVFRVTFSEGVTGVAAADFAASGTTAALSVAVLSASVYDVTLSGGNLAGLNNTVGLDFATSPTIQDLVGNAFSIAEPATDETYLVDNAAPSTTSIVRENPATSPTNSDTLVFRVTFSEGVTGVAAADFAATGTTATLSVAPVSASVYDVTLSGGNLAGLNGTVGLDFASPTIQDLAGNALVNVEPATDETYLVDNTAPSVTSFVRQNPATPPTNSDTLVFRVTFSEGVTGVTAADFEASGTTAALSVAAVSASVYDVTLSGGNLAGLNGTVGLDFATSPTIQDLVGNAFSNAEPATDETYLVDNTAPSVTSFVRQNPATSPTSSDTLVFRVTFSEGVTGVAASDFAASGTTAALSVAVVSASVYDVTLSGGNLAGLNGTVGLDFASPTVQDLAGNALANAEPATDETYLVDNTAPSVTSFVRQNPATSPTNSDTLVFRVTFSEGVTGVAAAGFAASGTTAGLSVAAVSASVYDVTLSGGNLAGLNGTVGLDFASPTIQDLAGNALANAEPATDETYLVDNVVPSVTSFVRQNPATSPTSSDTLVFRVTFSEGVTGVAASDFAASGTTAALSVAVVSASVYDVTLSGGNLAGLNGTVGLDFASPTVQDLAGNALANVEPSIDETYQVDNAAPTATSFVRLTPGSNPTNADELVFRVTFSEGVTGVAAADFAASGTTAALSLAVVSASVYDVTLSGGNLVGLNGTVGLDFAANPTIQDLVGNAFSNAEPATDETYLVDNTVPSVTSFVRQNPATSPTNSDTLVFRVTFSEGVTGVAAADFAATGTTAALSVAAVSASVYDVTLSGGNLAGLNGTVGLNFASPTIGDLGGNVLPNAEPSIDETYQLDNTAPVTISFLRQNPTSSPTNADTLVFRVTFNETVSGVSASDFAANGTSATVGDITAVNGSNGTQYDVTLTGGNLAGLSGVVGLNLAVGQNIIDTAGNALPTTEPGIDQTYVLNNQLQVESMTPTSNGFVVTFNQQIEVSTLNLYDQGGLQGAADLILEGDSVGEIFGSLVVDPSSRTVTFIRTAGVLVPDQYTITIHTGVNALRNGDGQFLDGNSDGTPGDDYVQTFVVTTAPASAVIASLPNFVRGYGQPVNLPANVATAGIPLTLSNGLGLSGLDLELLYDPTLLTLTDFTLSTDVEGRGGLSQLSFPSPGRAILTIDSTGSLGDSATSLVVGTFTASVPDDAPYGAKQVLDISQLHIYDNGPGLNEVPSVAVDAVHVAAFFGDTNGSGTYNSPDTTLIRRIIGQVNTGFGAYALVDPVLFADITLNGAIQSSDTTSVRRVIGQVAVANVPALPTGLTLPPSAGADPRVFIPQTLVSTPGSMVTVPVKLDVTEPGGITISGFQVALEFDATKFNVIRAQLGSLFTGTDLSGTFTQPEPGKLIFIADSTFGSGHFDFGTVGDLFTIDLDISDTAGKGGASLNLLASSGATVSAVFDNALNNLVLIPALTNDANDTVDGLLTVVAPLPQIHFSSGVTTILAMKRSIVDPGIVVLGHESTQQAIRIEITIKAGVHSRDRLRLVSNRKGGSELHVRRGHLRLGQTELGTAAGGRKGSPLTLTFSAAADVTEIQSLLRCITFKAKKDKSGVRNIGFQVFGVQDAENPSVTKTVVVGSQSSQSELGRMTQRH